MIVNLSQQHSLVSNWVSELRDIDIQNDRMRFRRNLERIGEAAAYEISKVLPFEEREEFRNQVEKAIEKGLQENRKETSRI